MSIKTLFTCCSSIYINLTLFCVIYAGFAHAADPVWRSELYPEDWTSPLDKKFETDMMIQDFSYAGYHMGEVPLPTISDPIFDVTQHGADPSGKEDSTLAIQKTINEASAKGGGVVYLPAGKFLVSPQGKNAYAIKIASSKIVFRGAGRDKTFLLNNSYLMRSKSILLIEGNPARWKDAPKGSPIAQITTDLLTPTTQIPVSSTEGFKVGDWVILRTDATEGFIADHNMSDVWAGKGDHLLGVMFQRQILSIDEKNQILIIDVPIRYYLKTRDYARIYKTPNNLEEVGVENFSIGNIEHPKVSEKEGWGGIDFTKEDLPGYDVHSSCAIQMRHARNSWISNVASYHPEENKSETHILSNGITLNECRGVTVTDCQFEHSMYGGGGGNGYMFRLSSANECLVKNSSCGYCRHGFVIAGMEASGNVYLQGKSWHTQIQAAGNGKTDGKGNDHHMYLSQSNLIDSNTVEDDFYVAFYRKFGDMFGGTPLHGQVAVHSVFWNTKGLSYHPGNNFIVHSDQARYGYIIGTSGPSYAVKTDSVASEKTAPIDFTEGIGKGDSLVPQSLYLDQLKRRLNLKSQ